MAKKTYQQIQAEIDRLQKEAAVVRQAEIAEVVAKIKSAITVYGLTAADLGYPGPAGKPRKPSVKAAARGKATKKKAPRPAKFRDADGHTWSGVGKRPGWFVAALAAGKTHEDLLVK